MCSTSPLRASWDGRTRDEDVVRSAALDALERLVEDVHPSGKQSHELGIRTSVGANAALQAPAQSVHRPRRSEEAIEVLDLGKELETIVALPETRLGDRRQSVPLLCLRSLDGGIHAPELREHEPDGCVVPSRCACKCREVELRDPLRLIDLRLGVRVDEYDLDALASWGGDEQELVAGGNRLLDDRSRERCEQVPLDGTLERSGTELGAEALLDEERIRGLVDLDRPRSSSETTPR